MTYLSLADFSGTATMMPLMLAKLCSAYKKPDAQTVLRMGAVRAFLRPTEVSKVGILGGKVRPSGGEAWTIPPGPAPGRTRRGHWDVGPGIDRAEAEPKTHVKSMMSSKNFRPSISSWNQGLHLLRILSLDLFARLNEARKATPGIWTLERLEVGERGIQGFFAPPKLPVGPSTLSLEHSSKPTRPKSPAPPQPPSHRPAIIRSRSSASLAGPKPDSPANKKPKKGTLDGYISPLAHAPPRNASPPKEAEEGHLRRIHCSFGPRLPADESVCSPGTLFALAHGPVAAPHLRLSPVRQSGRRRARTDG
ncbi:hypothetical protein PtA15_8A331 [Puccinia triticina]|uniref:Uncharacterized protein n=1 Tax=Puccinia triticina TaxID=208348 RepID=A0ABY7CSH2_9BASI|nr:uncharacterized protein PtA15_8A331 [Puccinia triticina]WAQ87427.1 hypothetical protein PtA15_8A331 [Puccinia triticina]WAR57280.1 hypothetical protein PtB15_8B327 [Puccinia triticina]